jgi:hypothetical protein
LERGPTGSVGVVGVVWQFHPKNLASVEVYWLESENNTISQDYEPQELVLMLDVIPEYARKLKNMLFPS